MATAALAKNLACKVQALPSAVVAGVAAAPALPVVRSFGGIHTSGVQDFLWNPLVPPGHTAYSWGVENQPGAPEGVAQQAQQQQQAKAQQQQQQAKAAPAPAAGANKEKKEKKQKQPKQPAAPKAKKADQPVYSRLDFRVGHVLECNPVPDSRSLVISKIDVGEAEPRQILSGLKAYYNPEDIQGTKLIAVCNLKTSKLMGLESFGMVLCAKTGDTVEIIRPPVDAPAGTPVLLEGADYAGLEKDVDINAKKDNSAWALIAPLLKTNDELEATCEGKRMLVDGKPCLAATLKGAPIS